MVWASPRSICAPADPAAPNARRQHCNCVDAVMPLLRIKSRANSRSSGLGLSSRTSRPLTMAPTGLMRSWHTREHNSAASSRASGAGPGDELPDMDLFLISVSRGLYWDQFLDRFLGSVSWISFLDQFLGICSRNAAQCGMRRIKRALWFD